MNVAVPNWFAKPMSKDLHGLFQRDAMLAQRLLKETNMAHIHAENHITIRYQNYRVN